MNDIHPHTIRKCLSALNDHLLSAGHDVNIALEAKTSNEAIGALAHLGDKLQLIQNLYVAAITAHKLT